MKSSILRNEQAKRTKPAIPCLVAAFFAVCVPLFTVRMPAAQAQTPNRQRATHSQRTTWVLLRNGEVMQGQIMRDGRRYKINLVGGGVASLPKGDIWRVEESLANLYVFRRDDAGRKGGPAQFELAKWCLRQQLLGAATKHLTMAQQLGFEQESLRDLGARIEVAVANANRPAQVPKPTANIQQVSANRAALDDHKIGRPGSRTITAHLPTHAIAEFTNRIQPLLVNRCGNAACHGAATKTDFELTRLHRRGLYSAKTAQQNAAASQKYINFATPNSSLLLEMSQQPHGGMTAPALNENQLKILRRWLGTATGKSMRTPPSIARSGNSQPRGGLISPLSQDRPADLAPQPAGSIAESASQLAQASEQALKSSPQSESEDPFDPGSFNRAHHAASEEPEPSDSP